MQNHQPRKQVLHGLFSQHRISGFSHQTEHCVVNYTIKFRYNIWAHINMIRRLLILYHNWFTYLFDQNSILWLGKDCIGESSAGASCIIILIYTYASSIAVTYLLAFSSTSALPLVSKLLSWLCLQNSLKNSDAEAMNRTAWIFIQWCAGFLTTLCGRFKSTMMWIKNSTLTGHVL